MRTRSPSGALGQQAQPLGQSTATRAARYPRCAAQGTPEQGLWRQKGRKPVQAQKGRDSSKKLQKCPPDCPRSFTPQGPDPRNRGNDAEYRSVAIGPHTRDLSPFEPSFHCWMIQRGLSEKKTCTPSLATPGFYQQKSRAAETPQPSAGPRFHFGQKNVAHGEHLRFAPIPGGPSTNHRSSRICSFCRSIHSCLPTPAPAHGGTLLAGIKASGESH